MFGRISDKHTHSGNHWWERTASSWPSFWRSKQICSYFYPFYSAIYKQDILAGIFHSGVHPISFCFDCLGFSKWFSHQQRAVGILLWNPVFLSNAVNWWVWRLKFRKTRDTTYWLTKKHGIHFRLLVTFQLSRTVQGLVEKEMTFVDFFLIYPECEVFSHCSHINVTVKIKCLLKLLRH